MFLATWYKLRFLSDLDSLTPLDTQNRRESWNQVKGRCCNICSMAISGCRRHPKREWDSMQKIHRKGAQEIRSAINEVSQSKGR